MNNTRQGAVRLIMVFCAGLLLFTGCKDLFHPEGPEEDWSPPSAPSWITASAQSSSSIYISWDSVSGISSYNIYRASSSYGTYTLITSRSITSYTDTGLSSNTTYYYKVSAYNDYGEGPLSSYASATTSETAPSTPTSVSASAQSSSSINVSWGSVSGASYYYVYRATSSYGSYSQITWTYGTSYTDTGLSSNTTYYYKVSAYNSYGESSQSSYTSATTNGTTLSPPTSVSASAQSSSSISVSWGSVSGASSYYIYRATSSDGTYSYIYSTSSTSYTDTGLSSNTTYYYKVSAYNSYGESSQSSYASATTSGTTPSPPSSVSASAQSSSSISVSWDSVSGASSYYIYRATSSYGSYSYIGSTYNTDYTDTGLSSNTTYYYKVSAYNSYGESSQSSYASATTSGAVPSAPLSVSASALSSDSISISWGSVSGASGYRVYYATSSGGSYFYIDSTTATSYTHTSLGANITFYYRVSAYNSYGESSQSSYASATTLISVISLSKGVWEWSYSLSPGDIHYYSFYASPGYTYRIYWEDYDYYNYYCDIKVSARNSSGTYLFSGVDVGYNGRSFSVSSSGYITIIVEGHSSLDSGDYMIMYDY